MNSLKTTKYGVPMTLTNKQFLDIFHTLQETRFTKGVRYALVVIKNSEVISAHLKELDEAAKPSEAFVELSIKAQELIKSEKFDELAELEKENATVIQERKEQMDKVNAKMQEEATLELKLIPESILPDDITADQIEKLIPIIQ
jgi:hypothetical protein